jgi:hypothetical protein
MTSRSNWAKDKSTFSVSRPMLVIPSLPRCRPPFSHGPDGSGAFYDGANSAQSCPSGHRDTLNCLHQGRFEVAPTGRANGKEYYDDIVFYRAWIDYIPGAAESYCQIALPKGSPEKPRAWCRTA